VLNDKIDRYVKVCNSAAQAVVAVVSMLLPFITMFVDKAKEGDNLKEDLNSVIKNLNEYKQEYTFGKYNQECEGFLKRCKKLFQSLYSLNQNNPNILEEVGKYMQHSSKVEELGYACKGYLDEMKSAGGKLFDGVRMFSGGFDTITTASEKAIDSLYKHLSMEKPKMLKMYNELVNEAKNVALNKDLDFDKKEESNPLDEFANIKF